MIDPVRIQRSRKEKQVSPNGLPIKYCGRPGKWGNPFSIEYGREWAISNYRGYINIMIEKKGLDIDELRGHNLSCWCKIGEPCHVDVLLELLNNKP